MSEGYKSSGNEQHRTVYELHRHRLTPGKAPKVEEYMGLDRARLAAFGYALDGSTSTGEQYTGVVSIMEVFYVNLRRLRDTVIDVIDERVAFRLLNELKLPRADQLSVSVDRLQVQANRLLPFAN